MNKTNGVITATTLGTLGAGAGYKIAESGIKTKLVNAYQASIDSQKNLLGQFKGGIDEFRSYNASSGSIKGIVKNVQNLSMANNKEAAELFRGQYESVQGFIKGHNTIDDVEKLITNGKESKGIALKDTAHKVYNHLKEQAKNICKKGESFVKNFKDAESKKDFLTGKGVKIKNKVVEQFGKLGDGVSKFMKADGTKKTEMLQKLWGKKSVKGAVIGLAAGLVIAGAIKIFGKKSEE